MTDTARVFRIDALKVLTRLPHEYRVQPPDALRIVVEEVLDRFVVLALPETARRELLRRAVIEGAVGGRIYDAHLGGIALAGGCSAVVTENWMRRRKTTERLGSTAPAP